MGDVRGGELAPRSWSDGSEWPLRLIVCGAVRMLKTDSASVDVSRPCDALSAVHSPVRVAADIDCDELRRKSEVTADLADRIDRRRDVTETTTDADDGAGSVTIDRRDVEGESVGPAWSVGRRS